MERVRKKKESDDGIYVSVFWKFFGVERRGLTRGRIQGAYSR